MARISEEYGNEYIQTADIAKCPNKRTPPLTILRVEEEDMGNRDKLVVSFVETSKRLPLNKTNALLLAEELGDESDDWKGSSMVLGVDKTMFQGKRVDCIRVVLATKGDGAAVAAAAAAAERAHGEIPF